jgi:hypothetical protein
VFKETTKALIVTVMAVVLMMTAKTGFSVTGNGGRVVDYNADESTDNCGYAFYSPFILSDPSPVIPGREEVMYYMGDDLYSPIPTDIMSHLRFSDKIYMTYKVDGVWKDQSNTPRLSLPVIDRFTFPWMQDAEYMLAHPESYIGSVASPHVVKQDGKYYMAFTASVDDSNVCAGEHLGSSPYGPCNDPWSYFVVYLAESSDGEAWSLVGPFRDHNNIALAYAAYYYTPTEQEKAEDNGVNGFKGISHVSLINEPYLEGHAFYFIMTYWSSVGPTNLIVGTKYCSGGAINPDDSYWWDVKYGKWVPFRSTLPKEVNQDVWRGAISEHFIGRVSRITKADGYKYIMTQVGTSWKSGDPVNNKGVFNQIQYRLSSDLVHWEQSEVVSSKITFFADGKSYDSSVIDPFYYEERTGAYSFYFASADDNHDGVHDCIVSSPEWTTAPYVGTGIYKGDGATLRLRPVRRVTSNAKTKQ